MRELENAPESATIRLRLNTKIPLLTENLSYDKFNQDIIENPNLVG
jgi:hypothetical protein